MRPERAVHPLHCSLCFYSFSFSSFLPLLFSFLPLLLPLLHPFFFFSSFSPFSSIYFISLSFPSFYLSPLSFASFFYSLFLLSFHSPLSFSFRLNSFVPFFSVFFFFFFLRELLVLNAFQDVIEDTADCNRM